MDIKPIETYYNGYRFRSRLEARWAVFFDALGVPYEYEPEGFSRNGLDIALFDRKGGDDFVGAANLQYVHELQYILRLCGIEKEIKP